MRKKIQDVYFRPITDAVFTIAAHSKKEAAEIAETELNKMTRDELIDRILNSIAYEGFKITSIHYADDDTD